MCVLVGRLVVLDGGEHRSLILLVGSSIDGLLLKPLGRCGPRGLISRLRGCVSGLKLREIAYGRTGKVSRR